MLLPWLESQHTMRLLMHWRAVYDWECLQWAGDGTRIKVYYTMHAQHFSIIANETLLKQDWAASMSQPYWVEVKVEVELRLILSWDWFEPEVEMRLSRSLVEIELRLSWVGVEISWHWIKWRNWAFLGVGLWSKICFRSTHVEKQHMFSLSPSILAFNFI